jgi:hypothetical protein
VARYFDGMVGTWVTDNTPHRSPDEPFDAYGMEWTLGIGGKTLVGRLYGMRDKKDVHTSWEFREFWHPGDGELVASQLEPTAPTVSDHINAKSTAPWRCCRPSTVRPGRWRASVTAPT